MKIGIIGCGNISDQYLEARARFPQLEVVALADLDLARARAQAERFGVAKACGVDALLGDASIEAVLNLTIPAVHVEVGLKALEAGKHVYSEKPLALGLEEARQLLDCAEKKGLRVGCAPDTFLGAAHQTSRKLLDDGWIGQPIGAAAFMLGAGPESWHPNPEFLYQKGAGPLMDMGPYYITAMVNLFGSVRRVCGMARRPFESRLITSQPKYGTTFPVEVDTFVSGQMEFADGTLGSLTVAFGVSASTLPNHIEIYGSEGTLFVPDPNQFGLPVHLQRKDQTKQEVSPSHIYAEPSRSVGLADMADAIQSGRAQRCSGELAYHVLEVMDALQRSAQEGQFIDIQSTVDRPEAMRMGLVDGQI